MRQHFCGPSLNLVLLGHRQSFLPNLFGFVEEAGYPKGDAGVDECTDEITDISIGPLLSHQRASAINSNGQIATGGMVYKGGEQSGGARNVRSEERRVGKEWRYRGSAYQ